MSLFTKEELENMLNYEEPKFGSVNDFIIRNGYTQLNKLFDENIHIKMAVYDLVAMSVKEVCEIKK